MTITPILYILHSTLLIYFGIKKTLTESIRDTNNKYNINIKLKYIFNYIMKIKS